MTAYNQSRVKQFRRCQKQYSFRYDYPPLFGGEPGQEMVPRVPKVQLKRGDWLHRLIQAHNRHWAGDTEFPTWEAVHGDITGQFQSLFQEEREELGNLDEECERIFRSYLRFWRSDGDNFQVATLHGGNGKPAVEFVVEVPLEKWGIPDPFKGRVDLLVDDREYGGLWVWDHKWVKTVPGPDERMLSPQAPLYVWALRRLGYDVRGFLYNYGRTKAPTIPHLLKAGTLSVAQRIDTDLLTYVREIKKVHGDRWKEYARFQYAEKLKALKGRDALWFRRERIPVDDDLIARALREFLVTVKDIQRRNTKAPPRSYFYNCRFGCEYHGLCTTEFQGLDITPLVRKQFIFTEERYGKNEDLLDA